MWRGPREGLLRTSHNTQTQDSSKEPSPRRLSEIYQISVARLSGTGSCRPFSLISVETVSVVRCHRAQPVFDVKVVRMRHHCKMGAHTIPFPLCPSFPCETCPPFLLLRGHMITQPLPPVSAAQTGTLSSFLTPESLPGHRISVAQAPATEQTLYIYVMTPLLVCYSPLVLLRECKTQRPPPEQ